MLKEIRDLSPKLHFPAIKNSPDMQLTTFSDASFNISSTQIYGQTGTITGVEVSEENQPNKFFALDWSSVKQRRVTHSSYGAEILAAADADDRGYCMRNILSDLGRGFQLDHVIIVDSKSLFDTITTLHENREYRLRQTVQRIRDSFESRDITAIRWVQTFANLADSLTKRNPTMHRLLNKILTTGILQIPRHEFREVNSTDWI